MLSKRFFLHAVATSVLMAAHFSVLANDENLEAIIPGLLADYARYSRIPVPDLQPNELENLAAGETFVIAAGETDAEANDKVEAMGLLGLQVVDAPRLLTWLTVLGVGGEGDGESDGRYHSALLSEKTDGSYARYQYVNLPWPLKDRHWVIYCDKNLELAEATAGVIWEHRWTLHESGRQLLASAVEDGRLGDLDRRTLDDAVYLPANRGTWALFDLGQNKTLILAFYDADLGGRLPGGLVRSFTKRQLRKFLAATGESSLEVLEHFDEESVVHDGFGMPISRADAVHVDREWRRQ
jgi:hypothetical protein